MPGSLLLAFALAGADGAATTPAFLPPLQAPALEVVSDPGAGHRAVLRVGRAVLEDRDLAQAVTSGLPLRLRFRVELWRDGFFDQLAGTESWTAIVLYEPLDGRFMVRTRASPSASYYFSSYDDARSTLEAPQPLDLRPSRSGRHYYTASLEVETLSLSDLEELQHWLKGELRPAVRGERSVPGAVSQGLKRVLIRVLGLPARRYEARSEWFAVG
ncbi:MAG: DUF4390 domain-containing protein [Gemmatimonadetes bacterium]|nr:DUF4390 domain-containing protein [Gemmatimonadota bacterium]